MARFFKEQDIDEFRDCFHLFARHGGQITTMDELTVIMRSLGLSPTIAELQKYMKEKGGKMTFAQFLDVMHQHTQQEKIPKEIIEAFRGHDTSRRGMLPARNLRHILLRWGECLSPREVDQIFREANIQPNGFVKYDDFVKIVCAPVPDYY
ncbi:Calmodulin-like protein 4 [Amphibalanus amphitrite]|uniref:Calmodulin-like protein 4 n=1 Tax=Amphibalanus amphitrite TaxID=1232801 RepID=A0A6A4WGZ2_AMPAM|nr:calmodulin-like protein 4 [Amphibalanus amphitrite]XP_043224509.1 calmodulin-like protein 4 [Amphibalanus amphitrite]KAF0302082.1 Calmodulin-like protein 4 [Amphibalanus amphitrite]